MANVAVSDNLLFTPVSSFGKSIWRFVRGKSECVIVLCQYRPLRERERERVERRRAGTDPIQFDIVTSGWHNGVIVMSQIGSTLM